MTSWYAKLFILLETAIFYSSSHQTRRYTLYIKHSLGTYTLEETERQPLKKCYFKKFRKSHRKIAVMEPLWMNLQSCTLQLHDRKCFWHSHFPMNFENVFETVFLQNSSWWVLLQTCSQKYSPENIARKANNGGVFFP